METPFATQFAVLKAGLNSFRLFEVPEGFMLSKGGKGARVFPCNFS